jgi:hypothetical protein
MGRVRSCDLKTDLSFKPGDCIPEARLKPDKLIGAISSNDLGAGEPLFRVFLPPCFTVGKLFRYQISNSLPFEPETRARSAQRSRLLDQHWSNLNGSNLLKSPLLSLSTA